MYWKTDADFNLFLNSVPIFRFIARPCAMGLKIQANGPQKAQANAILEKVFTAITKVAFRNVPPFMSVAAQHSAPPSSRWLKHTLLFPPASGWEEVGGPVQAAGLGREDHPALVQTAAQPGEAQHVGPLLRKHVSRRPQSVYFPLRVPTFVLLLLQFFCISFQWSCQSQIRLSLPCCSHWNILIRSSLAEPWPSSKRRPSGHRALTALFKSELHACLLIFILYGNDWKVSVVAAPEQTDRRLENEAVTAVLCASDCDVFARSFFPR